MSQKGNANDLLINFDHLTIDDSTNAPTTDNNASHTNQPSANNANSASMPFMCSTTPIYKLLGSGSIDLNDNNPFDQMDKKANLADDPFEIAEHAACASTSNPKADRVVEMGTLISLDSPTLARDDTPFSFFDDTSANQKCDTPKSSNVQDASQKLVTLKDTPTKLSSPTNKTRGKGRNDSLSLLEYSFSNSRTKPNTDITSPTPNEDLPADDQMVNKIKLSTLAMRRNSNDDSFDDIWSTKPNFIDSQTDIDVDSDIDSDLAKLNIPMLNESKSKAPAKSPEHIDALNDSVDEARETKKVHRNDLLVKFASLKQNNLSSPRRSNVAASTSNDSIDDVKPVETNESTDEPFTPISQYSTIRPEQLLPANNPNSLIDNLRQLVNQCDDQFKQSEAKHLLDNLSSLLTKDKAPGIGPRSNTFTEIKPIKRQGTFSIEKEENNEKCDEDKISDKEQSNNVTTDELVTIDKPDKVIELDESPIEATKTSTSPDYSDIVKQMQTVLNAQQNASLLQSNSQQQNTQAMNPIIVVIPSQTNDICDIRQANEARNAPSRVRSRSLNLKEKPLAALKAAQAKNEMQQRQAALPITPIKRPALTRRSSFGTIQRPAAGNTQQSSQLERVTEYKLSSKTTTSANAGTLRHRSLQAPITDTKEPVPAQKKETTTINRRRSFQCPPTPTSPGIRSPSPKPGMSNASSLTRRRSLKKSWFFSKSFIHLAQK